MSPFVCPRGTNNLFVPRGTNIFHTQVRGGGQTILTFGWGQTFLTHRGGQTFYVKDVGSDDDVDGEEEDVSEANILVSKASKLSAGARIFRGP